MLFLRGRVELHSRAFDHPSTTEITALLLAERSEANLPIDDSSWRDLSFQSADKPLGT